MKNTENRSRRLSASSFPVLLLVLATWISGCDKNVKQADNDDTVVDRKAPATTAEVASPLFNKGITALQNGDYEQAEKAFEQYRQAHPEKAGAYANLALIAYQKDDMEKALSMANQSLKRNPDMPEAYNLRGMVLIRKGEIKKANEDLLRAVELNDDYAYAHYNLALLNDIYLQEIATAIKHYEKYLSLISSPDKATEEWVKHLKSVINHG